MPIEWRVYAIDLWSDGVYFRFTEVCDPLAVLECRVMLAELELTRSLVEGMHERYGTTFRPADVLLD